MSKKRNGYAKYIVLAVLLFVVGLAAIVLPRVFSNVFTEPLFVTILLVVGLVLIFVGLLCLVVGLVEKSKNKKGVVAHDSADGAVAPDQAAYEVSEEKVRYVPSENVYNFIHMGDRQSVEEKFAEISKMDKTQFVIYVARLFSRKGYQVKFTPVIDNYNVDLLVEKMGVTIAVGCVLTTKVLGEGDIRCILQGSAHYPASNVMALTNTYFDKTAVDFAKHERMSLVDRNILAEDFMR